MRKRFYVEQHYSGKPWLLLDRVNLWASKAHTVQWFNTRAEARKWAKLANTPNAMLVWGNTGKLISVQIEHDCVGGIHHV